MAIKISVLEKIVHNVLDKISRLRKCLVLKQHYLPETSNQL